MFSLKASPPDSPLPFREGKQVLTARCIEEEETMVSRRSGFTLGQAWPPAVIVDHDIDVIRVVEGRRAAIERSVVELPFGGPRAELEWRAARSASKTRARTRHGRGRWQNRFVTRQRHPAGFPGCRSGNRSPRPCPSYAPARAPRRYWQSALPNRSRREPASRS